MNTAPIAPTPKREHKDYLDYLKAIAIIFVVVGHSLTYLEDFTAVPFFGWLVGVLVSSVHVPLFFVIAGYLCHKQPVGNFYRKRFLRVMVPYFTFAALKLISNAVLGGQFAHTDSWVSEIIDALFIGRAYWFAYCMFFIYLLAPLFWREKDGKTDPRPALIVCGVLVIVNFVLTWANIPLFPAKVTLFGVTVQEPLFQLERVIMYLPYFLVGMLIRHFNTGFIRRAERWKPGFIPLALILTAGSCVLISLKFTDKADVKMFMAFAIMYLLWLVTKRLPPNIRILKTIGKYSLQIMFFDSFIKVFLYAVVNRALGGVNVWLAFLIAAVNITLGCIACFVIQKIPRVRTIFGL